MRIVFASELNDLTEHNTSFDRGVLRVAYTGRNRNNSFISKETFEHCIPSIYNCPIVCRYDRDTDSIGSHDMELVTTDNGGMRLVNMTQPIGVVPESAKYWWEDIADGGVTHEYLCVDVLIWKRQEAYQKIKEDGITDESMEITVKDGYLDNGLFVITRFEFTAFCLLGSAEPCYESASLEMFSNSDFKRQFAEMMREFKETYEQVNTSENEDDNKEDPVTDPDMNCSMKGGNKVLDEKMKLMEQYGLTIDELDFSIDDFTVEELTEKFETMRKEAEEEQFALTENIVESLINALHEVKITREWGECCRYSYVDCDIELGEVYCWDTEDWLLYGFAFAMNGDNTVIDFESKTRKKYVIADFDEGDQPSPFAPVFELMEQKCSEGSGWETKYHSMEETVAGLEHDIAELRAFKAAAEESEAEAEREAVFEQFSDLAEVEAFQQLRENCSEYDVETLTEKCYAIRGMNCTPAKFSLKPKTCKLKVEKTEEVDEEPYGGVVAEYTSAKKH